MSTCGRGRFCTGADRQTLGCVGGDRQTDRQTDRQDLRDVGGRPRLLSASPWRRRRAFGAPPAWSAALRRRRWPWLTRWRAPSSPPSCCTTCSAGATRSSSWCRRWRAPAQLPPGDREHAVDTAASAGPRRSRAAAVAPLLNMNYNISVQMQPLRAACAAARAGPGAHGDASRRTCGALRAPAGGGAWPPCASSGRRLPLSAAVPLRPEQRGERRLRARRVPRLHRSRT